MNIKNRLFSVVSGILLLHGVVGYSSTHLDDSTQYSHFNWNGIKQFGTAATERGYFSVNDKQGNLYVAGYTGGDLDGNGPGVNEGGWDIYVMKLNAKGETQWIRQFGSPGEDLAVAIAIDRKGFLYVTGQIGGDLDPNDDQIFRGKEVHPGESENQDERDGDDAFLMKLNVNGEVQWLRQYGIADDDAGFGVDTDIFGNPYVIGYTWGDLDGDGPGLHEGQEDIYLTKFDPNGNQKWIKQLGSSEADVPYAMTIDKLHGNIYVTGFSIGNIANASGTQPNAGGQDIVAISFNTEGQLKWLRQFGTEGDDNGFGITVDRHQHTYISGYVSGDLDGLGPDIYAGDLDFAVIHLGPNGDLVWSRQLGTEGSDFGLGIAVDPFGGIYATGTVFGDLDPTDSQLYQGRRDIAVINFDRDGYTNWIRQIGTPLNDWGFHIAVERQCQVRVTGQTGGDLDGFGPQTFAGTFDIFVWKFDNDCRH